MTIQLLLPAIYSQGSASLSYSPSAGSPSGPQGTFRQALMQSAHAQPSLSDARPTTTRQADQRSALAELPTDLDIGLDEQGWADLMSRLDTTGQSSTHPDANHHPQVKTLRTQLEEFAARFAMETPHSSTSDSELNPQLTSQLSVLAEQLNLSPSSMTQLASAVHQQRVPISPALAPNTAEQPITHMLASGDQPLAPLQQGSLQHSSQQHSSQQHSSQQHSSQQHSSLRHSSLQHSSVALAPAPSVLPGSTRVESKEAMATAGKQPSSVTALRLNATGDDLDKQAQTELRAPLHNAVPPSSHPTVERGQPAEMSSPPLDAIAARLSQRSAVAGAESTTDSPQLAPRIQAIGEQFNLSPSQVIQLVSAASALASPASVSNAAAQPVGDQPLTSQQNSSPTLPISSFNADVTQVESESWWVSDITAGTLPLSATASTVNTSGKDLDAHQVRALINLFTTLGIELDEQTRASFIVPQQSAVQPSALPNTEHYPIGEAALLSLEDIAARLSLVTSFSDAAMTLSPTTPVNTLAEQTKFNPSNAAQRDHAFHTQSALPSLVPSSVPSEAGQPIVRLLTPDTQWLAATQNSSFSQMLGQSPGVASLNNEISSASGVAMEALPSSIRSAEGLLAPTASLPSTTTAANRMTASVTLPTPINSPTWPSQLGQQLVQFSQRGGEQHVQMQLHPAELGPLSIALKVSDQGAQAHFLSAHAQVRQIIELAIPQLREALAEQGIALGETSVGEHQNSNEQAFAQRGSGAAEASDQRVQEQGDMSSLTVSKDNSIMLDGRIDLYA